MVYKTLICSHPGTSHSQTSETDLAPGHPLSDSLLYCVSSGVLEGSPSDSVSCRNIATPGPGNAYHSVSIQHFLNNTIFTNKT